MSDFIIRVFKAWDNTSIERAWSNSYEVLTGDTSPPDLVAMAEDIILAERRMHLTKVHFLQYTISTWEADSHPYDPTAFVTVPTSDVGLRPIPDTEGNILDYNVCLVVKRSAATGRSGRLFYRGCLLESDVKMGGDARFVLDPDHDATLLAAFDLYKIDLAPYILSVDEHDLGLIGTVTGSPGTITRRPVTNLTIGGVTINKKNHRYFDRV